MPCDPGPGVADLWAMAAELERQFAGYKQRLADRTGGATTAREDDDDAAGDDGAEEGDDEAGGDGGCGGGSSDDDDDDLTRGRMYEAYVRRRDERLREGWRARMERKEAEVKALWAQLELAAGRAGERAPDGGDTTATDQDDRAAAAGDDDERKTDGNDNDGGGRRSSSEAALAPRRITGKKHARTMSFSSSIATSSNCTDVGRRRASSQEPPLPSEPDAFSTSREAKKESRVWPAGPGGAAATTTAATARPKSSLRRKNSSVKGHHGSSAKPAAGPKLPRSVPRRASSAGPETLGRGVAPAVVVQPRRSAEYAVVPGGTPGASPPRMSLVVSDGDGSSGGAGAANAGATSPEPNRGAVDEAVPRGEPDAKDAGVERHGEETVDHGELTSDSEPEPSYVYVNKDSADEHAMTLAEPLRLAGTDAELDSDVKASEEDAKEMPAAAPAQAATVAAEIATTNAEEAPARESSDESSLSVRSGPSARPSCSSRDQSIERLLEADAALLRKKREERAGKSAPRTPGSAGSRFSGTARSPRETTVRGFKRFLSFGKKNRGREVTVIDCTSPSVPSPADDDSASGRWQSSAGSIKPRMGSSDAASDDTDHGFPVSPQAACSLQSLVAASPAKSELVEIVPQEKSPKVHRSFFSFRSLNCGRS